MRILVALAVVSSAGYAADFTTYIGDSNPYQVAAITTDSAGNAYVTGSRLIRLSGSVNTTDVFVTKLDGGGNVVFTITFGGKGGEQGNAIAVDPAGNIWVGGSTSSENFPLHDALQTLPDEGNPGSTGFLVKLAQDGTVIYSSYFGGRLGSSSVNGLATDRTGNVYVTGGTSSSDFPTTAGLTAAKVTANGLPRVSGAFVTKLDAAGLHILYSGLIAGNAVDCSGGSSCFLMQRFTSGVGIGIDGAGDAFVAGNTNTTDLPVTPGGLPGYGAFAFKINAAGNALLYLTYLGPPSGIVSFGPSQTINVTAIATDVTGNAYLTGYTNDSLLPVSPGAYQVKLNADATQSFVSSDAFAVKLGPTGTVIWATYLGGPGEDQANSVSPDSSGNVWLVGNNGAGFPSTSRWFASGAAGDFLAELSSDGSALLYSAEFPQGAAGRAVAVDSSGIIQVSGSTGMVSTISPAKPFASRILGVVNAAAGQLSGRVAPGEVISIFGFGLGPTTPVTAAPGNGPFPASLGGVQVLVNGAAIPLLYVSDSQINAEVLAPLNSMNNAVVRIVNGSATLPDFRVSVDDSIVGVFQNADGSAKALNQDGTINSSSNPAKVGSIVSIWATGLSGNSGAPVDGQLSTVANNWCSFCQITVGSVNETVTYAGTAPGLIDGVMQVNFVVPPGSDGAPTQLTLDFEGASANLYVSP
jgi:uncharacterized protein (TIGR03437 family)